MSNNAGKKLCQICRSYNDGDGFGVMNGYRACRSCVESFNTIEDYEMRVNWVGTSPIIVFSPFGNRNITVTIPIIVDTYDNTYSIGGTIKKEYFDDGWYGRSLGYSESYRSLNSSNCDVILHKNWEVFEEKLNNAFSVEEIIYHTTIKEDLIKLNDTLSKWEDKITLRTGEKVGYIDKYEQDRGFGFISGTRGYSAWGYSIFFHVTQISLGLKEKISNNSLDVKVYFEEGPGRGGKLQAINVKLASSIDNDIFNKEFKFYKDQIEELLETTNDDGINNIIKSKLLDLKSGDIDLEQYNNWKKQL